MVRVVNGGPAPSRRAPGGLLPYPRMPRTSSQRPNSKVSLTGRNRQSERLWQFGYILDEMSFAPLRYLHAALSRRNGSEFSRQHASGRKERRAMPGYGTGLIAIIAFVVFAAAGHSTLRSHTTMDVAKGAAPELSDEQRGRIFDRVMRISDAPVTEMAAPEVAEFLPEEVPMQELPIDIIHEIPLVRGHTFVKFDDRILVVSSTSRLVVAMIPRYKLLP